MSYLCQKCKKKKKKKKKKLGSPSSFQKVVNYTDFEKLSHIIEQKGV